MKIREDIPLEKLRDYGFRNTADDVWAFKMDGDEAECAEILVNDLENSDRVLRFFYANDLDEFDDEYVDYDCVISDVLYKLIQDGIVEA